MFLSSHYCDCFPGQWQEGNFINKVIVPSKSNQAVFSLLCVDLLLLSRHPPAEICITSVSLHMWIGGVESHNLFTWVGWHCWDAGGWHHSCHSRATTTLNIRQNLYQSGRKMVQLKELFSHRNSPRAWTVSLTCHLIWMASWVSLISATARFQMVSDEKNAGRAPIPFRFSAPWQTHLMPCVSPAQR